MKTLEEIIKKEQERRTENGDFGIKACKESIKWELEISAKYNQGKTLFTILEQYVKRANEDIFFNDAIVLACWELINNK